MKKILFKLEFENHSNKVDMPKLSIKIILMLTNKLENIEHLKLSSVIYSLFVLIGKKCYLLGILSLTY